MSVDLGRNDRGITRREDGGLRRHVLAENRLRRLEGFIGFNAIMTFEVSFRLYVVSKFTLLNITRNRFFIYIAKRRLILRRLLTWLNDC